jgi:hypothetical protein
MKLTRVMRTSGATLSQTFYVDGVATDASGTVTVTVRRLNGATVASGSANHPGAVGYYTFNLPGQPLLDLLIVEWVGDVGGSTITSIEYVEIVGGHLFGLAEAAEARPPLDLARYPFSLIAKRRIEVEQECEDICGVAFVPRFRRVALDGDYGNTLVLPDPMVRSIRAITVDGIAWSSGQISDAHASQSGVVTLRAGVWPWGRQNVVIEYEHGFDLPPSGVSTAGITRLRSILMPTETSVPLRATSVVIGEGGVYRISQPSKKKTGIPDVDAAYEHASLDLGGFG